MDIEEHGYNNFFKSGDIVYDIGAHVGSVSIKLAEKGAKICYAFEPSSKNFIELSRNAKNYRNIIPLNVALHDKSYKCNTKFKDCRTDAELDPEQPIQYEILKEVVDNKNLQFPDFVKMDIEGMESLVLKTCDFLFKNKRSIFFVELHVAPKNERQRYENNPHWVTPEEGGFDFNSLKNLDYSILDNSLKFYDKSSDWNPIPIIHKGIILIPNEKI